VRRGWSAWGRASRGPSVSPSASLWVTAPRRPAPSASCQMAGATSATSGRGGLSSRLCVRVLLVHLAQQLTDPDAVGDTFVELEANVRGEAQIGQAGSELVPDEALSPHQPRDGRTLTVRFADHAHPHYGAAQVRPALDFR